MDPEATDVRPLSGRQGRSTPWPRILWVRARFPLILLFAFVFVAGWDQWKNYASHARRFLTGGTERALAVSSDTEFFCPMDPGVLSDWPGRCSICNMDLVPRKKGEATPLPNGVVARMQISPYRLQLAGVRVAPVEYRALDREIVTLGSVVESSPRDGGQTILEVELTPRDHAILSAVRRVSVEPEGVFDGTAIEGQLDRSLTREAADHPIARPVSGRARERIVIAQDPRSWPPGSMAVVRITLDASRLPPFDALAREAPPLRTDEPRSCYFCPNHPELPRDRKGKCPLDDLPLEKTSLAENERLDWWCPMHPEVVARTSGHLCELCQGMILVPRVIRYSPPGQVLAIPETSVIDTGSRKIVYVDRGAGMFDGVEVEVGPRCGAYLPVARGLAPGDRVVLAGALLLDAETRLNPSLAAAYFGSRTSAANASAAPSPASTSTSDRNIVQATTESSADKDHAEIAAALAKLPEEERAAAERQRICPVTRLPLGSMGKPPRLEVEGRSVFICCEGCENRLRADPMKFLAELPEDSNEPSPRP